jgi:transposase InsO family protein
MRSRQFPVIGYFSNDPQQTISSMAFSALLVANGTWISIMIIACSEEITAPIHTVERTLCTTMKAEDVTDTLELALQASGLDRINVAHRPRLLSDNGPSYVSAELAAWLDKQDMRHIRGAPYHPMTQGKIERWHLTLKNRILLGELLSTRRARGSDRSLRRPLQSPALPREHR